MKSIALLFLIFVVTAITSFRPCDVEPGKSSKWCDTSLSFEERAKVLVGELTLSEKVAIMGNQNNGVPRLNIPKYQWWSEALHGVAKSPGVQFKDPIPVATSFPQVCTTAQSFDSNLFYRIASIISTEARAFSNVDHSYLTFYSPNVNIFRDPRWGRGQETPGEDPYLTSTYAVAYVKGMQEGEDPRYLKVSACCKHYTAYDLEDWHGVDRFTFNAIVTARDMMDTFQTPFENCVKKARASSLMCSYNSVNGIPACADKSLLYGVARESWGFEGYITSDCGAIDTIQTHHHYSNNSDITASLGVKATCDGECGSWYQNHLESSVKKGYTEEAEVDTALVNLLKVQMRLGYFDPEESQAYMKYGPEMVNTQANKAVALEAARKGIVLLKNTDKQLPLALGEKKVAVVGPFAEDEFVMLGNYEGIPEFVISVANGIKEYNTKAVSVPGCENEKCESASLREEAIQATKEADVVVIAVGLNHKLESECHDREDLYFTDGQTLLIDGVLKTTKGIVILVVFGGGVLDLSKYRESERVAGILAVGYPGMFGGKAIAEIITGEVNPSGRLANTMYYNDYVADFSFFDMNMRPDGKTKNPGRTYRFFSGDVVYPFGYGLSYTTFAYDMKITRPETRLSSTFRSLTIIVVVNVTNKGEQDGEDSVLLFLKSPLAGTNGYPLKSLVGFQRVELKAGEEKSLRFTLTPEEIRLTDENAKYVILRGEWKAVVGETEVSFTL